jgi:AraC-type DNA-binding domain-containing proteins
MTRSLNPAKQLSRPGPGHVPAAVARDLIRVVEEYEGNAARFLRSAGLSHLQYLLDGREVSRSVARRDFTRLYAIATAVLDGHAARQEGRDSLTKNGVDMMCHAIITCRTLREVIARLARFSALLAPRTGLLTLTEHNGQAQLTMATIRSMRNSCAYLSDLTGLASYHRLLGWLMGEEIALQGAALCYPPLLDRQTIAYLLPHKLQHGVTENHLVFSSGYLERPVVRSSHELDHLLMHFPFDIEEAQSKEMPLSERINRLFAALFESGEPLPTAEGLSHQFSISLATLKRRLEAEGTSFAQLKATALKEATQRLLADPRLSIAEIARQAHFSDATAFRRAFARWTGTSPTVWRRERGTNFRQT